MSVAFAIMLATLSPLGVLGIVVLAIAVVILLITLLHPEGLRRPGGYLDGEEPQREDTDAHGT